MDTGRGGGGKMGVRDHSHKHFIAVAIYPDRIFRITEQGELSSLSLLNNEHNAR